MKTITGFLLLALAGSASAAETFTASAESKSAGGSVLKAPVTISYTSLSTPAERDAIAAALKSGGHEAARKVLLGMKDIGVIEAPNGAHLTNCQPDYERDETFQKAYAAAAADPQHWAAFTERFLSGSEADYQAAVNQWKAEQ